MIFHIVPIHPSAQTPLLTECSHVPCTVQKKTKEMLGVTWFNMGERKDAMFCCYRCLLEEIPEKHLNQA